MTKSIFGGNPQVSHFSAWVRYNAHPNETSRERSERRTGEYKALKDHGVKQQYRQFRNGDEAGKAKAKALATADAARVLQLTGVTLEVSEGCFL